MTSGPVVERRAGEDRRSEPDRRSGGDRRSGADRRAVTDRRNNLVYLVPNAGARRSDAAFADEAASRPRRNPVDEFGFSVLDAVSRVYDAALDGRVWPRALARLRDLFDAEACALAQHDVDGGGARLVQSIGLNAGFVDAYATQYGTRAPWLGDMKRLSEPGEISLGQGNGSEDDFRANSFWCEWMAPQGLATLLCGVIDNTGGFVTHLLVARSPQKPALDQSGAMLMRRILPGIQRALCSGRAVRKAEFYNKVAFDALDAVPFGIAFVDAGGEINAANTVARQIVEAENVRAYQESGRRTDALGQMPRFRRAIAGAMCELSDTKGEKLNAFAVPRRGDLRPLTCLLVALEPAEDGIDPNQPHAMLFMGDPEKPITIDQRRLRELYGLSRAEARVVALLAQGHRLDATAENLGLVYETVRKHLKQAFGKTGCDRQAELVRLLVTGPAGLAI